MMDKRIMLTLLLSIAVALAGCASSPDGDTGDAGDPTAANGGSGEPGGDGEEEGETWQAFTFGEPVEARGEPIGALVGYTYDVEKRDTITTSDSSGETGSETRVTAWTTEAAYHGESVETIRATRATYDQETFESEEETVSTEMAVQNITHTVEVQRDDRGRSEAGDTATVTILLDAEAAQANDAGMWNFVKIAMDGDAGTGTYEVGIDEEMQEEQKPGEVMYGPYMEGDDPLDWWAFDDFALLYGLGIFQPLAEGAAELDENASGMSGWDVEEVTFEVSGHTFDGYRVTSEHGEGSMSITIAPELPVPYLIRSESSEDGDYSEYQLTAIALE